MLQRQTSVFFCLRHRRPSLCYNVKHLCSFC